MRCPNRSYLEAHQIQQRILVMERDEYEKWNYGRQAKIKNMIQQLKQKQLNELNALQQRIISGQEEQRKIRSQELEKLLQKYQNVRKELESQQTQEITRLDKSMKNTCKSDVNVSGDATIAHEPVEDAAELHERQLQPDGRRELTLKIVSYSY